ncbi:substrate-binding domain-containing protein [Cronobacter sakazakii]
MHKFTKALAAIGLAAVMSQSAIAETMKLGFLVKQPEEPWFQTEWKFADKAGKDLGFEVIKIAVPDGEKTLNAIDSLAASGAKGFVICTPDPKLGSAIVAKARGYDMKVIAVDDQFVTAKGKPMETVPLVMMAATTSKKSWRRKDLAASNGRFIAVRARLRARFLSGPEVTCRHRHLIFRFAASGKPFPV